MTKSIYVGNIPYKISEDELGDLFKAHGDVESVKIIKDKFSGRSKGFAFIEMGSEDSVADAVDALNGKEIDGRKINVSVARDRN